MLGRCIDALGDTTGSSTHVSTVSVTGNQSPALRLDGRYNGMFATSVIARFVFDDKLRSSSTASERLVPVSSL